MYDHDDAPAFLRGGGEMGDLMRRHDWSASALGPPDGWPQSLRTVVSLMLTSKFPMFTAWGEDLSFLYNDAYRPIFGSKHPDVLGRPFREAWSDIWVDIEPLVTRALAGEATYHEDLHLVMERNGYAEDTWYTFSYSPVIDESGSVGGMFCACTETTQEVKARAAMAAERQRLHDLFKQAPSFMAVLTGPEHVFEFANDAYLTLIGNRPDIIGKPLRLALPEIVDQGFVELLDSVMRTGKPVTGATARVSLNRSGTGAVEERFLDFIYQPIKEADGGISGVFVDGYDVTERKRAEDQQSLLARELNHRVKNLFAVAGGMVSLSARTAKTPQDLARSVRGRLDALARANELISPILADHDRAGLATLEDVAKAVMRPFMHEHDSEAERISIRGPRTPLGDSAMTAMALALHELATNAAKYGGLSDPGGSVSIAWKHENGQFSLRWDETSSHVLPDAPATDGFGSLLIERSVAGQLQGTLSREWRRNGLSVMMTASLERLSR